MITLLKAKAEMLRTIRNFFETRAVLEVDTPLLRPTVGMEPHIVPMEVNSKGFLQNFSRTGNEAITGTKFWLYLSNYPCV